MEKYHDEISKTMHVSFRTLRLYITAINRYMELLAPYNTKGNTSINNELEEIKKITRYIKNTLVTKESYDNDDMEGALTMLGKHYGKLYDILWKYHNWKKQALKEKEAATTIQAALEGDRSELERVHEILKNPIWE